MLISSRPPSVYNAASTGLSAPVQHQEDDVPVLFNGT